MARKDTIHDSVKQALINDGWTITDDPLVLDLVDTRIQVDLAAEKFIVAQKETIRIIIEVKSFSEPSIINAFYAALGQYLAYRDALNEAEINSKMYLSVSDETYARFNEVKFIKRRLTQYQIKLIVIDVEQQTIIQWIE